MAASHSAPKQWPLTKNETITSYESWRQNFAYTLSLDTHFAPFLGTSWQKKSRNQSNSGLNDDGSSVPEAKCLINSRPVKVLTSTFFRSNI